MSIIKFFSNQTALLWKFLTYFQPPFIRILHIAITLLVIINLILGYGFLYSTKNPDTYISSNLLWIHISISILLTLLTILFIPACLFHKGIRHFYPYLWGDTKQLISDLKISLSFKLIPPKSGGLAAVVQGLGLGALLLTVLSELIWFIGWRTDGFYTHFFREVHKVSAILLALYLLGHGTMATIHFIVWQRRVARKKMRQKKNETKEI